MSDLCQEIICCCEHWRLCVYLSFKMHQTILQAYIIEVFWGLLCWMNLLPYMNTKQWVMWRKSSSGIWHHVVLVRTDVSEERIASIFRAGESRREYSERVAAVAVADFLHSNRRENLKSYNESCVHISISYVLAATKWNDINTDETEAYFILRAFFFF
jgi:hypothetical protein